MSKVLAKADSSAIHSLTDMGNNPSTKYILSEKIAVWIPEDQLAAASDSANASWFKKEE